jgi:glycosyltransferase involved in cell wall biosynthesis
VKVLQVIPAYFPATLWGGPIHAVYGLNQALARLPGVEIKVLTTDCAGPGVPDRLNVAAKPFSFAARHEAAYCRRTAFDSVSIELLRRLPALVRWADIVHLTYTYSFPTIPTIVACRLAGKPLVWSPRGALQFSAKWESARRPVLKRAWEMVCSTLLPGQRATLHVTAEEERVASQGRISRARLAVVPNGVEIPALPDARVVRPEGMLRLMYLARMDPIKGLDNLLRALALLPAGGVTLDVYGQGDSEYTKYVKALAVELGLSERVRFRGHVAGDAKTAAFLQADVCVIPSHHENFCNVVAESLAHGVPVVVSKGAPWSAVETRGCGVWVDNDPQTLARAILQIAEGDLRAMGARGRAWMVAEYSWDAIALRMRALYESTIQAGDRAAAPA